MGLNEEAGRAPGKRHGEGKEKISIHLHHAFSTLSLRRGKGMRNRARIKQSAARRVRAALMAF
jgi:hypothetical protein